MRQTASDISEEFWNKLNQQERYVDLSKVSESWLRATLSRMLETYGEQKRKEALIQAAKIIENYDICSCHGSPVSCSGWKAWTDIIHMI